METTVNRISDDTFTVPSQSQPGSYWIVKHVNGNTTCDCPAGFYRGHCKHGRAVENYLIEQNRPKVSQATRSAMLSVLTGGKLGA